MKRTKNSNSDNSDNMSDEGFNRDGSERRSSFGNNRKVICLTGLAVLVVVVAVAVAVFRFFAYTNVGYNMWMSCTRDKLEPILYAPEDEPRIQLILESNHNSNSAGKHGRHLLTCSYFGFLDCLGQVTGLAVVVVVAVAVAVFLFFAYTNVGYNMWMSCTRDKLEPVLYAPEDEPRIQLILECRRGGPQSRVTSD